jgi:hypothetical protein
MAAATRGNRMVAVSQGNVLSILVRLLDMERRMCSGQKRPSLNPQHLTIQERKND